MSSFLAAGPDRVPKTERGFLDAALDWARARGWLAFHDNATSRPERCPTCQTELTFPRNEPGFPDLVIVRDGALGMFELKSDRGRATPAQAAWLDRLLRVSRFESGIWRPRDWDKIVERLK